MRRSDAGSALLPALVAHLLRISRGIVLGIPQIVLDGALVSGICEKIDLWIDQRNVAVSRQHVHLLVLLVRRADAEFHELIRGLAGGGARRPEFGVLREEVLVAVAGE